MADIENALLEVCQIFKILEFNSHQKAAFRSIINDKCDLFVNLPTGFGKSLIFQALPLILDRLDESKNHIVVVVSPLINLITDQVNYLNDLGIKAVNISAIEDEQDKRNVEKGSYKLIYGTPEAWLLNERWRNVLKNPNICGVAVDEAHVIKQWGISTSNKMAPFRECYSRLHEFRALTTSVPIIALTATATKLTREAIFNVLMMQNPKVIFESVNKQNVTYSVVYMNKDNDLEHYFGWLADEVLQKNEQCDRTIIYCQTIKQCSLIYATLKGMLGKQMFADSLQPKSAYVEMLHSCTPAANKENILLSFSQENGNVRILVATIAFGMGVNCKGVKQVIHFGPSKNIESYTQETGRAGRDGSPSIAFLLYNGFMLAKVEADIKSYVLNNQCRRQAILKQFDESCENQTVLHQCCDYCTKQCECGSTDCGHSTTYPTTEIPSKPTVGRSRDISNVQMKNVHNKLFIYYKSLLKKLVSTTAANVKTLTGVQFLLGFSDVQIQQVANNLQHLFTLKDICELVEIWDMQHAHKILGILNDEFGDTDVPLDTDELFEFDDEFMEEWEELLGDDELLVQAVDNLSVSQLNDSLENSQLNVSEVGVPNAALETLDNVHFSGE